MLGKTSPSCETSLSAPRKKRIVTDYTTLPSILMILPSIICLCVFSFYPLFWMLKYTCYDYTGYRAVYTGAANFIRMLNDKDFWSTVGTTFEFAAYKLLIVVPFTFVLSVLLAQKIRGSSFFRGVFYMPVMISVSISAMVFGFIFGTRSGIINGILLDIGWIEEPIKWLQDQDTAVIPLVILGIWGAGTYILYFTAGLTSIDETLYEAAEMDGANGLQRFWHITLPMLSPVMKTILLVAVTSAFKDYETALVMTNGGPAGRTTTMFLYIYNMVFGSDANAYPAIGYGAMLSVVASLIVGVITLIYLRVARRLDDVV